MRKKGSEQLSLGLAEPTILRSATPESSFAAAPSIQAEAADAIVYLFRDKKHEKNQHENSQYYKGILGLVNHFN